MPSFRPNDASNEWETPLVAEDGDIPFRYLVESRSGDIVHTVDLTARDGHGECDCMDFQTRANPNFKRHGQFIPYAPKREGRSECVHIAAARDHYHLTISIPMLARFRNGIPAPNQKTDVSDFDL